MLYTWLVCHLAVLKNAISSGFAPRQVCAHQNLLRFVYSQWTADMKFTTQERVHRLLPGCRGGWFLAQAFATAGRERSRCRQCKSYFRPEAGIHLKHVPRFLCDYHRRLRLFSRPIRGFMTDTSRCFSGAGTRVQRQNDHSRFAH